MPKIATITAPDGRTATLTIPDGATTEQLQVAVQKAKEQLKLGPPQTTPFGGVRPTVQLKPAEGTSTAHMQPLSLQEVRQQSRSPEARSAARDVVASTVRVGGGIASMAAGMPFLGGAASAGLADVIETGQLRPGKAIVEGALNKVAPGMEGGIVAGAVKGAGYGVLSETVNAVINGQGPPTIGRLAFSTVFGGISVGAGRKFLRSALSEVSTADVTDHVATILSGHRLPNSSSGEQEAVGELLPGIKGVKAGLVELRTRNRAGQFLAKDWEQHYASKQLDKFLSGKGPLGLEPVGEEAPLRFSEATRDATVQPGQEPLFEIKDLSPLTEQQKKLSKSVRQPYLKVPKAWFSGVEEETFVPVYREVYGQVEPVNIRRGQFEANRANDLRDTFSGLKHSQREKYQAFLEAPNRAGIHDQLKFKIGDRIRTGKLQGVWEDMFQGFGLEDGALRSNPISKPQTRAEEFLQDTLPRLRRAKDELMAELEEIPEWDQIVKKAFPVGKPKALEFFEDGYRSGTLGVADTDSLGIVQRHLNYGSYQAFVEPTVQAARAKYVSVNPKTGQHRDALSAGVNYYLNQVQGTGDPVGHDLALFMERFAKKLRIPGIDRVNARDIANTIITSQYSATLGLRPGPIVRNSLQTIQTGYSELGSDLFKGMLLAKTARGHAMAERIGLFEGETSAMSEVTSRVAGGGLQKVGKAMGETLRPYKGVDESNRAFVGLGQWIRSQRAIRKAGGDVNKFIDMAWLDSDIFLPAEQKRLQEIARSGDFTEAARQSAVALADNTQFNYRPGNRPRLLSGTAGRSFGGFGSWAAYYSNYLRRLFLPSAGKGLTNPQGRKNAIRLARFVAAHGTLVGVSTAIGSSLGVEDAFKRALSWNFLNPAIYTGGPVFEEAYHGIRGANELTQGQFGPEAKESVRGLTAFVPGAYLARDFDHLIEPDKGPGEAVARTLGILPRMMR